MFSSFLANTLNFKQLLSNFEPQNLRKNKQLLGVRPICSCLFEKSVSFAQAIYDTRISDTQNFGPGR